MTTQSDATVLMLLGELKEGLSGLKADMAEVKAEILADRNDSLEGRRRLYDKLVDGEGRLTQVESTVRVMGAVIDKQSNRINALEPVVRRSANSIVKWNWRWGIVVSVVTTLAGGMWWAIRANWQAVWDFIKAHF